MSKGPRFQRGDSTPANDRYSLPLKLKLEEVTIFYEQRNYAF